MGNDSRRLNRIASALGALALIVATALHAMQMRETIYQEEREELRVAARVMSQSLNRAMVVVQELLEQLDLLVSALPVGQIQLLNDTLRAELRDEPLVLELAVLNRSGRIVASSTPGHLNLDVSSLDLNPDAPANYSGTRIAGPYDGMGLGSMQPGQAPDTRRGKYLVVWHALPKHPDLRAIAVISSERLNAELAGLSTVHTGGYSVYTDQSAEVVCSDEGMKLEDTAGRLAHPNPPVLVRTNFNQRLGDAAGEANGWLTHLSYANDFPLRVQVRGSQEQLTARWMATLRGPLALLALMLGGLLYYGRLASRNESLQLQAQAQQRTSEQQLANIVEHAAEGIVTFGMDGVVRRYNRAAESILGVQAEQALGHQLGDLFPPNEVDKYRHLFRQYVEHFEEVPEVVRRSARITRLDGRQVELEYSASRHNAGTERFVTAIVRDVSSMKEAEARFAALFMQSSEPQMLMSLPDRVVIDCNEAAVTLLEAGDRSRLIGRTAYEMIPTTLNPDGRDLSAERMRAGQMTLNHSLDAQPRVRTTARIQTFSGSLIMVDLSGAQVRLGGQVTRLLTLRDLTAMERDAAELRSARETAEAAAQAKGRFLAVMSHELRTPMSGIIGMIDMLGETRMDLEQAKFLSVLRNSSHALLTVLNDVLDYSKLEAGRVELEQVDFDLDGLVSSVMAVHRATALQRNTTLTVDWSSEPIRALRGDPTRLAQVLHNLVGNAVKFTSNGTVTLKMQTLPASNGQLTLAAQVRDTGVGMAPEMLESLFRPFSQGDASTTRRFGGTGLGLAICRQLIIAMGGSIDVDSAAGRGSAFNFTVTLFRAIGIPDPHSDPLSPTVVPLSRRSLKLLAAEDNPTNRLLLELRLRKIGHQIDLVEDGEQAVEAARFGDYDAILMDIHMPVLDGAAATRAIRALPEPNGSVPIIGLSADALPEMREQHMTSGLTAYLTKPIDWSALARLIEVSVPPDRGTPIQAMQQTASDQASLDVPVSDRLDAFHVDAVRNEFGADNWELIAHVFWPRADADLAACVQATTQSDRGARRMAAHSLKGAATTLGFHSLAQAAANLEHCEDVAAPAALDTLRRQFATTAADWRTAAEVAH